MTLTFLRNTFKIMKINRKKLYEKYMEEVEKICEECDWVTNFGPREIVEMISEILEKNEELIEK